MRISEVARRAGVTTKSVRYYESMGLIRSRRLPNGYRDYDESQARLVAEVRALSQLGIRLEQTRPFVDCLVSGHDSGSDCPDSVAAYRRAIDDMTDRIDELTARRSALIEMLTSAELADAQGVPRCEFTTTHTSTTDSPSVQSQEDNHAH